MIVDTSAIVAILRGEPEAAACSRAIFEAQRSRISAANWLEAAMVVDRWDDPAASRDFDALMLRLAVEILPVTAIQVRIARDARRRFGKGTGHPAKLNFGDCFAYALAIHYDELPLFIGQDFVHTDVRRVLH